MKNKETPVRGLVYVGIDPSLSCTGIAVIDSASECIAHGVVTTASAVADMRLLNLWSTVKDMLEQIAAGRRMIVGVEENIAYPGKSVRGALLQREAIAVCLLAAMNLGSVPYRVAPAEGKKALTGKGNADKLQMVEEAGRYVDLSKRLKLSREAIADALGIALAAQRKARKIVA